LPSSAGAGGAVVVVSVGVDCVVGAVVGAVVSVVWVVPVVEPVVVVVAVVGSVVLESVLSEEAVELELPLPPLPAITTIAITRPTMTARSPATMRRRLP
jgi:hypothetical protein